MINYQKKPLLVMVGEPRMIRREAKGNHNEVTVAVVQYALPLDTFLPNGIREMNSNMLKTILDATSGYPGINLDFNKNPKAPALIFTVKAKTERRGDDTPNQEFADKLVLAKVNLKACAIVKTIINGNKKIDGLIDYYEKAVAKLCEIDEILSNFSRRESTYIGRA